MENQQNERLKNVLIINGKIVNGMKSASVNLPHQKPFLEKYIPELKECYDGSINVELEIPLRIFKPDVITDPLPWVPNRSDIKEIFHLTQIGFELLDKEQKWNEKYKAWIYGPQNSPHRENIFHVEVIAQKINFRMSDACKIYINKKFYYTQIATVE